MFFNYYTNAVSQASKGLAKWIFTIGLLLVGFGVVILAFPEVFAFLAALVFFIVGIGCAVTAVRIFRAQRQLDKINSADSKDYRKNVQIHTREYYDI